MIVMIDNYDSFTYNLVQYIEQMGFPVHVIRNDAVSIEELEKLNPAGVVISPGPGNPDSAGISLAAVKTFSGRIPILGVCLGHQTIGQAFGGQVVRAAEIVHGKMGTVHHAGQGVFRDLPSPFQATRYHSLVVERESLPDCLQVTAWLEDGTIMGLRHRDLPVEGVQFHPESIASEHGHKLLRNFLDDLKVAV